MPHGRRSRVAGVGCWQGPFDPARLVFADETATSTNKGSLQTANGRVRGTKTRIRGWRILEDLRGSAHQI
jgi:hypothetical protein